MNNRILIGGIIALIILLCVVFLCYWAGKSVYDRMSGTNDPTVNQPANQPPNPSTQPATPDEAQAVYLALGNPSAAAASDPNNYLLVNKRGAVTTDFYNILSSVGSGRLEK